MQFDFSSWLHRKRIRAEMRRPGQTVHSHRVVNPYHAVGIAHEKNCCSAVIALKDQRFLSRIAPTLPLLACDVASCRCRYQHFEDRRAGSDRRAVAKFVSGGAPVERRLGQGRRATD